MDAILTLQQKRLLRADEAARILNVSRWTVVALINHHCVGVPVAAVVHQGPQALQETPGSMSRQDLSRDRVRSRQERTV
jgi:hypothetical protein